MTSPPDPAGQRLSAADGSLWSFSLAFYALDGVAARLIDWQDRHGVDVNVVLTLSWLAGCRNRAVDAQAVELLVESSAQWRRDVVVPLRTVRRALKSMPEHAAMPQAAAIRERVKTLELECERSQQLRLEEVCQSLRSGPAPAGCDVEARFLASLESYCAACAPELASEQRLWLAQRLRAFCEAMG